MIPKEIIIHHTASSRDKTTIKDVDSWHRARGFNLSSLGHYCGYHYLILGNGQIIQTRRDNETGCHCIPNDGRIGVCLMGNFEIEIPTNIQLDNLKNVLEKIKKDYGFSNSQIKGHCEVSATLCPGKSLISWIKNYRQVDLNFLQKQLNEIMLMIEKLKKIFESLKGR